MANPSTSSSSARVPAATSPRSARRSLASRPRSSSATISAASASTGAASRPRRCCARPRSSTTCSMPRTTGSPPRRSAYDPAAVVKRSRGVVEAAQRRRRLPDEEEQGRRDLGRGGDRRAWQGHGEGRQERGSQRRARPGAYQAKHIIIATGARPRVLPGLEPDKKLIWTYFEAMVPDAHAEIAAGRRLGRDRHRVRLVLPHASAPR